MSNPSSPLVNLDRARAYMNEQGIDGIIACLPYNVYYLSGYWGLLMKAAHFDAAFFAVLPAREDQSAALVIPSMELRRLVTQGGTWMDETFIFTSPEDQHDAIALDGNPYGGWPVRDGAELTPLEHQWIDATKAQANRIAGNGRGALARAIQACGLESGNLVTDDARVGDWLASSGMSKVRCKTDADAFRHIRLVKTAAELELMRTASIINEQAARAAVAALREGADWHDTEVTYATQMAASGGQASYLMCGAGGPPARGIRRDEPMLIDALGTYQHYHGDFGRCIVLGEPSPLMRQRHAALCAGYEAAQAMLKPGTRYQDLASTVVQTVQQNGLPEFVYATPHSLGLEHTDDPRLVGSQQGMNPDIVLEPDMVLNIDMPFTEIGWGSVHMEDTVVITEAGFEQLTSQDQSIIQVG